jgi:hypothetical protein
MTETNLAEVKRVAKTFLYLPFDLVDGFSPVLFVQHPFLASCIIPLESGFVNVFDNPEALEEYQKMMSEQIDKSDLTRIFVLMRKPYHLAFLKYCYQYLSEKDFAEYFAYAWVNSENPNQDANCSITYLIRMFKKCNKEYLMTEEDYAYYDALPETFTIYRGVAVGRNPKGLSWTQNLKTAQWFAHRFDKNDKKGYVQVGIAEKKHVLAYFNTRNEDEIVYNTPKLKISILEED